MTTIVIDTDVASFRFRGDPRGAAFAPLLREKLVVLTFVTVAEMLQGAAKAGWGRQRLATLTAFLAQHPVVYPTAATCRAWAAVRTANPGRVPAQNDAWIAACAIAEGAEFVTNNLRDFESIADLRLLRVAGEGAG